MLLPVLSFAQSVTWVLALGSSNFNVQLILNILEIVALWNKFGMFLQIKGILTISKGNVSLLSNKITQRSSMNSPIEWKLSGILERAETNEVIYILPQNDKE